jgi:uncharacterized protein YbjT (DUF2867 family)
MKIVVIGGSGLIESKLVTKLREQGHEAIAASPNSGVNTVTGEGLTEALKGAAVVYFRAKMAQENLIKGASLPYTIVRATQFFEFVKGIAEFSTQGNKVHLPSALIQPMAADDVASLVGKIAASAPVNGLVEIGGPEQFPLDELVRQGLTEYKDPREVVADPKARYYGVELSERTLLPDKDARLGETRFKTWLAQSAGKAAAGTH